jgi:hypothetical protein
MELYRTFAMRQCSRDDLGRRLAERILERGALPAHGAPVQDHLDHVLAYTLSDAVCSLLGPEEDVRLLVDRVLTCLEQLKDTNAVLDLLPLIRRHDRFSVLVSKYDRGLISRTGIESAMTKSFPSAASLPWLLAATQSELVELSALIEADDYKAVRSFVIWDSDFDVELESWGDRDRDAS